MNKVTRRKQVEISLGSYFQNKSTQRKKITKEIKNKI